MGLNSTIDLLRVVNIYAKNASMNNITEHTAQLMLLR
jgi:hypothetical protein